MIEKTETPEMINEGEVVLVVICFDANDQLTMRISKAFSTVHKSVTEKGRLWMDDKLEQMFALLKAELRKTN